MYDEYVYVDEKTIRLYIGKHGRKLLGKDYELGAAVILKNFFEIESGSKCLIGVRLNPKHRQHYKERRPGSLTVGEVKDLIERHVLEDDLIDIAISPIESFHKNKNTAWIIQLKRFGHFQKEKSTKGLIQLLLKTKNKYPNNPAFLVIFFDGHKGIKLREVSNYINKTGFPFSKIMFINTTKNKEDAWKINIGEIWPNYGYNEYEPRDLVKVLK